MSGDDRYVPARPDTGHVMEAVQRVERKVDELTRLMGRLLQALAEDDEPEEADLRDLEGQRVGAERDQAGSLG
jgi:hypothetical protein